LIILSRKTTISLTMITRMIVYTWNTLRIKASFLIKLI
jgi:hypothetical protein